MTPLAAAKLHGPFNTRQAVDGDGLKTNRFLKESQTTDGNQS
jgi:hypothetical protein